MLGMSFESVYIADVDKGIILCHNKDYSPTCRPDVFSFENMKKVVLFYVTIDGCYIFLMINV